MKDRARINYTDEHDPRCVIGGKKSFFTCNRSDSLAGAIHP
jgi:hypothetical protein